MRDDEVDKAFQAFYDRQEPRTRLTERGEVVRDALFLAFWLALAAGVVYVICALAYHWTKVPG
jgi:hypothetical protein